MNCFLIQFYLFSQYRLYTCVYTEASSEIIDWNKQCIKKNTTHVYFAINKFKIHLVYEFRIYNLLIKKNSLLMEYTI